MSTLPKPTRRHLDRLAVEKQAQDRIPGLMAGVARSGRLVWNAGVGSADLVRPGVAPDADTQFDIASNTKTFVAVAVMALRDEGRLSLDDTVDAHVPESTHGGVTIRQLLAHVSGMQREPVGDVWDTLEFPDRQQLVTGGMQPSGSFRRTTSTTTATSATRSSRRSSRGSTASTTGSTRCSGASSTRSG